MSVFIRYVDLQHSANIIEDYIYMGKYYHYPDISEEGKYKLQGKVFDKKYKEIYCCPSLPCLKTAEIIGAVNNLSIFIDDNLRNIRHDFNAIYKGDLRLARKELYRAFIEDTLLENKMEIIKRVQRVIDIAKGDERIFITHGILLSLIRLELLYGLKDITLDKIVETINLDNEIASSIHTFEI